MLLFIGLGGAAPPENNNPLQIAEGNKLHEFAAAKLSKIEALLRSYLEKEFDETVSRQRAGSLMLHVFGMRVYGYQQDSAETVFEGLKQGLPWLPRE